MSTAGGSEVVLAIDQGTSGTKALVIDGSGTVLGSSYVTIEPTYGDGATVEIHPDVLFSSVLDAGRQAVAAAGVPIDGIGIANQGETVLVWDQATGLPRTQALIWQDRRAAEVCARIRAADTDGTTEARLRQLTGLHLDEYFAAPKMAWLREHMVPRDSARPGVVTMVDSWLLHQLTGAFVTDTATASRSLLLDLDTGQWSDEALAIFGLDGEALPELRNCAGPIGTTTLFGGDVPITAIAVDQQASLFGQGCTDRGMAKCTYGTGAFLQANLGTEALRSKTGLASCVAWSLQDELTYCLEGQVFTAGSAVRWLRNIGLLTVNTDLDRIAGSVPDTGGVLMLPALAGLGAPYWSGSARGAIHGITLQTEMPHFIRAMVEGIAAQVVQLVTAMESDLGERLTELRVDGGLTRSTVLMQLQADLLQIPVHVFQTPDATALGIGALARIGLFGRDEADPPRPATVYEPSISADQAAERMAAYDQLTQALLAEQP